MIMTMFGHKKNLIAASLLIAFGSMSALHAQSNFRDVSATHWANDAINNVSDLEIMKGDPSGNFSGYRTLNRYELAVVIDNLMQVYNAEFAADREDLSNLVTIMEQFQDELRILEKRTAEISAKLDSISTDDERTKELAQAVQLNNEQINSLQEKGFWVDTVIKGNYNDIKKVFGVKNQKGEIEEVILEPLEAEQKLQEAMPAPMMVEPSIPKVQMMAEPSAQMDNAQRYDDLYEESELIEELEDSLGQ